MKLKTLTALTVAGLSLTAVQSVSACALSAWSSTAGSVVAAEPDDPTPVARYAGRCAALSDATGDFVTDNSPNAEATYRARFYVRPNASGATIFRATSADGGGGDPRITVGFTGSAFSFAVNGGAAVNSAAVTANAWYSIELNWSAGQPMTATIQGNNGAAPLATVTVNGSAAADRIDSASLGWVAGAGTGTITTDAFESRRQTAIGRLCKGNANIAGGSANQRDIFDVVSIRAEINGQGLAAGTPDFTEDGSVNVFDVVGVRGAINSSPACP